MQRLLHMQHWILLIHQLPPTPTNLRVRIWRKLQRLGAIAIKNSVYVLPFNEGSHEDFQWLKQEIETAGGEAAVMRANAIDGATDNEIIERFRQSASQEYERLITEMDTLCAAIRDQKREEIMPGSPINTYENELDKMHKDLERTVSTDFFVASNRAAAQESYQRCHKAFLESQNRKQRVTKSKQGTIQQLSLAKYQGRRWVTRQNLFVDRLAAVWLIKRFIDRKPRFYFIKEGETVEAGIGFDLYGGQFTHRGEDCTFETMIKEFGLAGDQGLKAIAEIVHDIDLKDNKFNRSEAAGLNAVLLGMVERVKDDRKLAKESEPVFDSLYQLLRQQEKKAKKEPSGESASSNKARKRPRNEG
ncbi:MAG TPA: chromate resistance protein ChrB domain-containing protein [Blastocatellia bacterium]|nr:chromate resistance protein ChrB domain-containing protein [Blastocatellia bacterium]